MRKLKTARKKIGLGLLGLLFGLRAVTWPVQAQLSVDNFKPIGINVQENPGDLTQNVMGVVFVVAAALTFAFLVYGAIQWITAGGDSSKVEGARKNITGATIGLLVLASVWAFFTLVMGVGFGQNPGEFKMPDLTNEAANRCGEDNKSGTCPSGQNCVRNGSSYVCTRGEIV